MASTTVTIRDVMILFFAGIGIGIGIIAMKNM